MFELIRYVETEKKSNEKVMEMAGYKRSLLKTTRKRRLQFLGHINRADGLEKQVERFVVPKAEEDDAQNTHTSLNNFVTRKESPIRRIDDREDRKAVIAGVCNRPVT